MDAKQEVLNSLQNIWTKLQNLPEANSIEIGGFLILLLFICKQYLLLIISHLSNWLFILQLKLCGVNENKY